GRNADVTAVATWASISRRPMPHQRSVFTVDRIFFGWRNARDAFIGRGTFPGFSAQQVGVLALWIPANHVEIRAGPEVLVSGAGGKNDHVARLDIQGCANATAQSQR